MLANESSRFDLPEELLEVLPSDPFEQLDVARKITSIALSTRVEYLESELSELRQAVADRDSIISGLESQLESFDASLGDKLAAVQQEKESLARDNAQLSNTVRKLTRDVAKLEAFRKTLMRSLQDDDDKPVTANAVANAAPRSNADSGNAIAEDTETDAVKPRVPHGLLLASQTSTPRLTPHGSPPSLSASVSPSRTPNPMSPRRHSVSFSTTRGLFDDRSSVFSSVPSSQFSSMSSLETGPQPGKTRVDGKEFFRQVRSRLTYEQFGAFLANVKELNSHKKTKEETLRKADEILGPDNKDLYAIFEGLITRNVQ